MGDTELSMPLAVPPPGVDPSTFYATFTGKLIAAWSPATGLVVSVDPSPAIARLHAPMKAAMHFAPAGSTIGGTPVQNNTLVLTTWPMTYATVKEILGPETPAQIRFENVDGTAVRAAVEPLFTAIGRPASVVDDFIAGDGLLRVGAGIEIGAAAPDPAGSPSTPNGVKIKVLDATAADINPVQFLVEVATHLNVDKTLHPILAQLDLDGRIEVVALDEKGAPLQAEPYILYLSDGTRRTGITDSSGGLYETQIPAGSWGIDFPNHSSFTVLD